VNEDVESNKSLNDFPVENKYECCKDFSGISQQDKTHQQETLPVRQGSVSSKKKALSHSMKNSTDDVETLKSESYPCIFVPDKKDSTETGSTCSSFTESCVESMAGRSSANSYRKHHGGRSVIFACGMQHVLSFPPFLKGEYTGQVEASTKVPHGLGSFSQIDGKVLEGIWEAGVLVTAFGAINSPSESDPMSQEETPIIRNRSNLDLCSGKMPKVPLPTIRSPGNHRFIFDENKVSLGVVEK
jgi:hypothetical protein